MDKQKKQQFDYKQKWRSARKLLEEIRAKADQDSSDSEDESSSIGCVVSAVNTADVNSGIQLIQLMLTLTIFSFEQIHHLENFEQEEHHHLNSPFSDLPTDMISTVSVDYIPLVCLGVMRRLLLLWIRGPKPVKLSAEISRKLLDLKAYIPNVFARKPRGLNIIDRRKATELRQFLLYSGKLALKGILRRDLYDHFMVLSRSLHSCMPTNSNYSQ